MDAVDCLEEEKSLETQENPDLEDGEIEDDDDDEEPPPPPPEPEKSPEIKAEVAQILPAPIPTDVNSFAGTPDKNEKTKRHGEKKGKGHLTEAEKCVRMLHKLEREARERRERDRRREQLTDDWAGNVEKAIANALKKPDKQSGSDAEEEDEGNKKRGRKRKKRERDRKKKHRKTEVSPKEEIDENEMLNVRGGSPEKEASPFAAGEATADAETYESFDSEYDSDTYRQNKRNFERERKRDRNRNREQLRRERKNFREKNNRKKKEEARVQQQQQQQQDANSLCMFYMQGKCHKGDDCPYSHDALPPMKLELCKFYLMECCAKRDKCLYMHSEFPCKYYHTGLKCLAKDCKFAHGKPLSDSLKQVLLKHLETAPKEILGEFPRLSREGAQHMVNQTQHNLELQYGVKPTTATTDKTIIPSLFDITIPMPPELMQTPATQEQDAEKTKNEQPAPPKEKKVRQTRWNDGPAVPVANLLPMINPAFVAPPAAVQTVFPQLNLQDQQKLQEYQMNYQIKGFYSEQDQDMRINSNGDVDMRTLQPPPHVNFEQYCQDAKLTSTLPPSNTDTTPEKSDTTDTKVDIQNIELAKHDVDIRNLPSTPVTPTEVKLPQPIIEPPIIKEEPPVVQEEPPEEIPNLPKKQRELFLRIQAQQKENPPENEEKMEEAATNDDDWYSSDDENDPLAKMVIHLEDEENPIRTEDENEPDAKTEEKTVFSPPQILIKPVEVFDKLGDLSKIDISDEVTKLLQTMQGNASVSPSSSTGSSAPPKTQPEVKKSRDPRQVKHLDPEITSPKSSGSSGDPRTAKSSGQAGTTSQIMSPRPERRLSSSQRITIYEQGIINLEEKKSIFEQAGKLGITAVGDSSISRGDVDLRTLAHSEDMDLRQNYGDTDLRMQTGRQDVDLRQLGLPFKGMQNYTPASEIDASIASHGPLSYKVHVCDIPRPDYTGLRLTPKDAEISADPRLKKIFRVALIADSPASPKAAAVGPSTSPKPTRQDPRRRNDKSESQNQGQGHNQSQNPSQCQNLTYNQQLQLLQNSAFYQSLTSNQKLMLNQEIASKGGEQAAHNDPILSGILSSLGLIPPNTAHNAPALNILNNVNSLVPPMLGVPPQIPHQIPPQLPPQMPPQMQSQMPPHMPPHMSQNLPNMLPHQMQPPPAQLMQNQMGGPPGGPGGPNLGPGLLGAAPEYPINFDPRNGGLLGQAPFQQQNFNENQNFPPYNEPGNGGGGGGGFNQRGGNFRGENRGNRRGGPARNWGNRHNNRNYNNRNMNNRNNRTNRSYTPP